MRQKLMWLMSNKTLCLYCAAASDTDPVYQQAARDFGQFCGENNFNLVYGGGHIGLMGLAADSALENGAHVTGVIPKFLQDREIAHSRLSDLIITETLQERQTKMAELADGFVILPGGFGTLAELFEILTWKQLGLHDKPVVIVNVGGYWDHLNALIQTMRSEGFLHNYSDDIISVISNVNTDLKKHF
jgi:uncharacterized protein (TIGR00730 family)